MQVIDRTNGRLGDEQAHALRRENHVDRPAMGYAH